MIGISACLLGNNCKYDGGNNLNEYLKALNVEYVLVCPEVMGGLSIPRDPSEIISNEPLMVHSNKGRDVTINYIEGSKKALALFKKHHIKIAILKHKSPSCGNKNIYDGTFSHSLIEGKGVFVRMCEEAGIKVFNETQIDEFMSSLDEIMRS